MKDKKLSYWIWVAIVFVLSMLLTWLVKIPVNIVEETRLQAVTLGDVSVYVAVIFSCNIFGLLALIAGSALGMLCAGVYGYIIPVIVIRILMFLTLYFIRKRFAGGWKTYIISAAIAEGVMVIVFFLFDLIFRSITFGQAASGFFAHLAEGAVCGLIGLVLMKLFQQNAADSQPDQPLIPSQGKKRRNLN